MTFRPTKNLNLVVLNGVEAPQPFMRPDAAKKFNELRAATLIGSGIDFLAKCGDIFRSAGFVSSKDGVANRSWHKAAVSFDYDQTSAALVISGEIRSRKQFFRTYLKCIEQDGSQGVKLRVRDYRNYFVNAYLYDFTEAAEDLGFNRIPAWNGWRSYYNRREFWHYQYDQGLTWAAAMAQLASSKPASVAKALSVLGLNDRGPAVQWLQVHLNKRGFLPSAEIDGVFGAVTKAAVEKFQKSSGILTVDGIAGRDTLKVLGI